MASQDSELYLAILKASYDYEPQSEDEIAIKEDQLLFLIERVDEEWWKVKIKGISQDTDSPIGLVPAAYVEQAEHTSIVKALYDYEAAAPGEISVHEDDVLMLFDTEDDWILVQNSKAEGGAGYVPGNYVEVMGDLPAPAPSRIIVPDSPPLPVSTYIDPADRVAATKVVVEDDIQTWQVSEIDKKGKKKKGQLGIGGGTVFFASEADKTPVQKWKTKDIATVAAEKSKHVSIDIEGPSPISLHFHAGSKDNADAIVTKLQSSKALSSTPQEHAPMARGLSPPLDAVPSGMKKPSVHFSPASPVIIPSAPEEEEQAEEGEEEEEQILEQLDDSYKLQPASVIMEAVALYDFGADGVDELSVTEGERLTVLEKDGDEWWKCRNSKGLEGVVPASYLEAVGVDTTTDGSSVEDAEVAASRELAKEREREAALLAERQRQEQEEQEEQERRQREAAAARKVEAQRKAKESAAAAEVERQKRKDAAARASSPPTQPRVREPPVPTASSSKASADTARSVPDPEKTRVWHDRSGQFRVEAAFLGFNNGKLRLHKVNGVIVEVPSEKMSVEDMRYVERTLDKGTRSTSVPRVSDDDIPLAISKVTSGNARPDAPSPKKAPKIDWFDFFLSAGCEMDDCTRYAASFERDKIDESILGDITDGTMRSLGMREGDIIRVSKAIEKRKPTDNLVTPSAHVLEQLRRDEELARQLQAQESSPSPKGTAPNLFSGPGGILKPRRGRPQPSKSLPPSNVDLKAITSASGQIQRTTSPQTLSPATVPSPITAPSRPSSASVVQNGFDDDAWTNRPSSTKPSKATSPSSTPRAPSVPPIAAIAKLPTPTPTTAASPPQPTPTAVPASQVAPSLSNVRESDVFEQLARLSELRKSSTPAQPNIAISPTLPASSGLRNGMGMSSSPLPMGQHLVNQTPVSSHSSQLYNGPRGPFAPVPANQGLLQPLIPTQTGFTGFVPTKPVSSPFLNSLSPPPFLSQQPTGNIFNPNPISRFQGNNGGFSPVQTQPTGFNPGTNSSPFNSFTPVQTQPTGFNPSTNSSQFNSFPPVQTQPTGFNASTNSSPFNSFPPVQAQPTGFNGNMNLSPFNAPSAVQTLPNGFNANTNSSLFNAPPPVQSQPNGFNPNTNSSLFSAPPPVQSQPNGFNASTNPSLFNTPSSSTSFMPPSGTNNTSPANIFAQMKTGNFATDNDNNHNMNLGPHSGLQGQTPVWSQGYTGYQR